jgi:DNA repair photolyase
MRSIVKKPPSDSAWRGRGVTIAPPHRYARLAREPFDDGWAQEEETPGAPPTEVRWEEARSAITTNRSPDLGFDRSLNPYRGCEHGCAYCYARPMHAWLDLSPGLDFERIIIARRHLAERLREELARPGYRPAPIALGTATDAWQPVERKLGLTRAVLEVLAEARHPWSAVTKGSGILRDLDLIAPMAAAGLCEVYVTLTTLDAELARRLEPRAASPRRRLEVIAALAQAGVPVGVSLAPQIPFLTEDMEAVLAAAAEAGAMSAFMSILRLPHELEAIFDDWLQRHFPERRERILARLRELHGGALDGPFGARFRGQGPWAELLAQRFAIARRRAGLDRSLPPLAAHRFRPPARQAGGPLQQTLF